MTHIPDSSLAVSPTSIFLVSGGSGYCGAQLLDTMTVQFAGYHIPIITLGYTRTKDSISEIIERAAEEKAIIAHTMVNKKLREFLIQQADEKKVSTVDLMGPMFDQLSEALELEPAGQPGLYRKLHHAYFDRIRAIEFAIAHDDGANTQNLHLADVVLTGPSRSGKTPLSMYLAVLGWKVANVPILQDIPLPRELFKIDRLRVFGLVLNHERLLSHRRKRNTRLGLGSLDPYVNPATIFEEIEAVKKLYRKNGFSVIGVTDKPIETSADEVIEKMARRFKKAPHQR